MQEGSILIPIWTNKREIIGYKKLEDINERIDTLNLAYVILFDRYGMIFITKPKNSLWEGKWSSSAATTVRKDETSIEAARRALSNDLGAYRCDLIFVKENYYELNGIKRVLSIFYAKTNDIVKVNSDDIAESKWVNLIDIKQMMTNGEFNPVFLVAFENIKGFL